MINLHLCGANMLEYEIIEETLTHNHKTEYGVAMRLGGKVLRSVPRLSDSRADIEKLTALLNELEIEPCHFDDVIEDYLTDFTV